MKALIDMVFIKALNAFGACAFNEATTIAELQEELLVLNEQAMNIQATADAENRELTEEEQEKIAAIFVDFKKIEANIARREQIDNQTSTLQQRIGRQTDPDGGDGDPQNGAPAPAPARQTFANIPNRQKGTHGFNDFGEFASAVQIASMPNNAGRVDPRLIANAPTTYSSEGVGADGGFAVPPEFRAAIMETVMAEASLMGRTDSMTSTANAVTLPRDDTTSWQSSGGVQAYWEGENKQLNQSKISLKSDTVRLNKLTALVPVTEELLSDASAIDSYLRKKVPEKFDYKINDAIINGTGAGMPLGLMNSGSLITVAKESGQAADTIVFENIVNMWSRMYAPSRQNGVWLVNQDIEPQLLSMGFPTAATAVPVYLPAGGLSATPYGSLMGRPVIPVESAQTLGDKGDIVFADLSQYLTVTKTAGIRSDVSMHLWFDYDTLAYRFIFRVAGQPWRDSTISPANGSATRSSFITLAARA